jgi:DNA repair exonuclease SbcCD nuclease subunit
MSNLFKKVAAMTDLHVGLKSNSLVHLRDCEDFVDWFISEAKRAGCETGIFLGDWSHHRNSINLITLDTSIRCLEKLGAAFNQFFWFPGNHDLFYKDKREVHSTIFGRHIPGVTIIEKPTTIGDVTLIPWLVGDEWKSIGRTKSRYIFGHLELPSFFMNAMVQMPNHGELQSSHFENQELVFSGHFHKRQNQKNIWYIGNAFPHNYADAWDDDRGMMILEWGQEPQFKVWTDAPKFRTLKLSRLIDEKDTLLKSKMYLKVNLDIDISFEEANYLKETFSNDYNIREFAMFQEKARLDEVVDTDLEVNFQSVDQVVTQELVNISSNQYDHKMLLDIYRKL